jgi:hypothetical protein
MYFLDVVYSKSLKEKEIYQSLGYDGNHLDYPIFEKIGKEKINLNEWKLRNFLALYKTKKMADFTKTIAHITVRERVKLALYDLIKDFVQFLPIDVVMKNGSKETMYILNVHNQKDYIDMQNSIYDKSRWDFSKTVFKNCKKDPIFYQHDFRRYFYVNDDIKNIIESNHFTGIYIVDVEKTPYPGSFYLLQLRDYLADEYNKKHNKPSQ